MIFGIKIFFWPPPGGAWKSKDQKMRYFRKLENQLCLFFGPTNKLKRVLKHIILIPPFHVGHLKKIIRSLDPRVPILLPSAKFAHKIGTLGSRHLKSFLNDHH